jgi:hypothetical protein
MVRDGAQKGKKIGFRSADPDTAEGTKSMWPRDCSLHPCPYGPNQNARVLRKRSVAKVGF